MKKFFSKRIFTMIGALSILLCSAASSQITEDTSLVGDMNRAQRWLETGSYHVARRYLESILPRVEGTERERSIQFLLMQASFSDKDYEEAYNRAGGLLSTHFNDDQTATLYFIHGVSAFQTQRLEQAIQSLTNFLDRAPNDIRHPEALYWRALSKLDLGDWQAAESDLDLCFNDVTGLPFRDHALMGYALSLERRGQYVQALDKLETLLSQFPSSDLRPSAQIRLASVALRLKNPEKTLQVLSATKPQTDSQREEMLLLKAEASYQLHDYLESQHVYETFVKDFPKSRNVRKAQYGLAWSHVERGDRRGAQTVFDSLSRGNDSLAFAAMYQSGLLSLLDGDNFTAMARFDTLVEKSPYDQYLDQAYVQMGMIHYRGKYYRDARHDFQLAARLYPNSAMRLDAYRMMGECSFALADFPNAVYAFSEVRKLDASGQLLADAMFQEGVSLYHVGRFRSSADRLSEFLQKFPHDHRANIAYVWQGEALYQDGKFEESQRAYENALRSSDNPKKEEAMYGIAWTLFEQKKFSQAATAFDRFTTTYPSSDKNLEASLRKADCYYFLGQYDKSSALYSSLENIKGDHKTIEYAAFQLGMSYIERGETDRGIDHLRNFLIKYPTSIYAEVVQFNIGWTYFSKERFQEAIKEFQTLQKQYPESQLMPRVLFNTGDAFFNLKSYDSARTYYQRVVREYPSSPLVTDALAGLQYTSQAQGRPSEAIAEIDTFLTQKPAGLSQEDLLLRKAGILFDEGDYAGALPEYQRLLNMKPHKAAEAKAQYQIGRIYELEHNPARAVVFYQKVTAMDSVDSETGSAVALALGLAHIKLKQYRFAVEDLQGFDKRFTDSPLKVEAGYQLGVAQMNVPMYAAAIIQFQSIIQQHPEDIFADKSRLQIARIHLERKEYGSARDTLNVIVNKRGDDLAAEALITIGDTYLAQKKFREALQAYHDVIQQYTDFPIKVEKARFGLGQTYERMADKKQARLAYQEILKSPVDPEMKTNVEQRLKKLKR